MEEIFMIYRIVKDQYLGYRKNDSMNIVRLLIRQRNKILIEENKNEVFSSKLSSRSNNL